MYVFLIGITKFGFSYMSLNKMMVLSDVVVDVYGALLMVGVDGGGVGVVLVVVVLVMRAVIDVLLMMVWVI